jgi:hypothetical protein
MKVFGKKLGLNNKIMGRKLMGGNILGRKMSINQSPFYMPPHEKEKISGLEKDFRHQKDHINTVTNHLPMEGQPQFQHHSKSMSDRKAWQRKKHG